MRESETYPVTIIDGGSSKTSEISNIVKTLNIQTETIPLTQANQYSFQQSQAVIISGGPHLFTESHQKQAELMSHFSFLKSLERPTLGICLGHQAIALTFGGKVYRGRARRDEDSLSILKDHPLFKNLPEQPVFSEDHCEGVQPSNQINILAHSECYGVEAIEVIGKPLLGVQFHPEVSGQNGKQLIVNFLEWAKLM